MTSQTDARVLRLPAASETGLLARLQDAGHRRPLLSLATALAASPPARSMSEMVLAIRERPDPVLVLTGAADPSREVRLDTLAGLIDEAATRLRPLSWGDVEEACHSLAARLKERLGPEVLADCSLVGVPRGGLVVAGLLAYTLGIPRERVTDTAGDGTLVLVDDCLISGVRLRETLAQCRAERIVVATLCSSPDLRRAVEEQEERVVACVSGVDLHDHGPELLGDGYPEWRRIWSERVPARYHTALLDLVAFPWSEPGIRLWNPVTSEVEENWWLAPPAACVQHRECPPAWTVQVADDQPGFERLRPPVVPVQQGPCTDLIDTESLRGFRLSGTAQAFWREWSSSPDVETAAGRLADRYDQPMERIRADLLNLLGELRDAGLVERSAAP